MIIQYNRIKEYYYTNTIFNIFCIQFHEVSSLRSQCELICNVKFILFIKKYININIDNLRPHTLYLIEYTYYVNS